MPISTAPPKGKMKEEEEEEEVVCGICLYSSGDLISRGFIDSCSHYFCFVCIMEWAKVESRCPLCKRRFSHIRRPPKPGVLPRERLVPVPLRDQIYHQSGNASVGPPNLYSDTNCSVCHSGADEALLLLCDLCDTASHSYCAGLGATVPEGDWFCPDCSILKAEHSVNDDQEGTHLQGSHNNLKLASSQHSSTLQNEVSPQRPSTVSSHTPTANARTLVRCRNVHDRIQALRANWSNIRNGSFSFTSTLQKPVIDTSSGGTEPSIAHGGASNRSNCSSSHEINRAWKMMDMAIASGRNRKRSMPQSSNSPLKKIMTSKDVVSHPLAVSHKSSNKDACTFIPRTPQQDHSLSNKSRCATQLLGRQPKRSEGMISAVPGAITLEVVDHSPTQDGYKGETGILLNRRFARSPLTPKGEVGVSCNSSTISPSLAAIGPHVNPQSDASLSPEKRGHLSYRGVVDKKRGKDKLVNGEIDAKREILTLVKLNLKILTKNQKLEDNAFKQVARTATHSIVAACESEHPKPGCQDFPSSICCHTNDIQQQRRSSLMHNSCRECFYAFVKDVVSSLLNDKRM